MRVALSLLAVSLLLAGCGAEEAGVGVGSTQNVDTEASDPLDDASSKHPPRIFLESAAGRQQAVEGSFCVSYSDPSSEDVGIEMCSDGPDPTPQSLSTVRAGDEIRILLEEGEVVLSDGCFGVDDEQECIGTGHVSPLGCERKETAKIAFAPGPVTSWKANLAPGAYEVDFFLLFVAPGRGGDVSGAVGLLVDEAAPLEIVPAADYETRCRQSR